MPSPENTLRLRRLMAERRISCPEAAHLLHVTPGTVYNWHSLRYPSTIPLYRLELLELKLAAGTGVQA